MTEVEIKNSALLEGKLNNEDVFVFPASFAQKRMWFLDRYEPESPYYNIPAALRLKGKFNIKIFKATLQIIVNRHESLRTNFASVNGEILQIISQKRKINISVEDLTKVPDDEKEIKIYQLAKNEARTPFNLRAGALFRAVIIHSTEEENVILLTMHHIISDGWSMGILVKEICAIYSELIEGKEISIPDLKIQYADFSEWQKKYLSGKKFERQYDYWKNILSDNPPVLELPVDKTRPVSWSNEGASISYLIDSKILDKLYTISRQNGSTIFMILLSAYYVLLSRYSGQNDISVGTPIANRTRAELENIIGLFINTLVLRCKINKSDSFKDLLLKVKEVTLGAYENQDLPFELLVEKLQPERNITYPPLFQVMFILQNTPNDISINSDLQITQLDVDMGTSTFDLTFNAVELFNGLQVSAEFNTDLFEEETIRQMLIHFENILREVSENPDMLISRIKILSENERKKILYEWNNSKISVPGNLFVHNLIEKNAAEIPGKTAVKYENSILTYSGLNNEANRLAYELIKNVKPEDKVAVYLERSIDIFPAVLGVMKSGAAYLPMDTLYPAERIQFMLKDSDAKVIVTNRKSAKSLPQNNLDKIFIDDLGSAVSSLPNPKVNINEENLVYTIYTSGSTGTAKGVGITHRNLLNIYLSWEEDYKLKEEVNVHLQMANFTFDVFTGDFVRALCSGGMLVAAPRDILLDGKELFNLIQTEQIKIAEFVPAVLRNLINYLAENGKTLSSINTLIAGSDVWYVNEYKKFKTYLNSGTRVINSFGLTECTIDSSFYESEDINLHNDFVIPIGKSFANTSLLILDENFNLVPPGVKGELFITGTGIARGYLNNPAMTAEKFLPNSFGDLHGERIYRTGDAAKYLKDGNVEFIGRIDNQIKIRGFRVELGEIEAELIKLPGIKSAVVTVVYSNNIQKLAAYVIAGNSELDRFSLREQLLARLPEYMIPSAFVVLEKFPLSSNGKIDRKLLPPPDSDELQGELENLYVAPKNSLEENITAIWKDVLDIDGIGIRHNFFVIGGHSLLATQIISRIKDEYNIELPLRKLFEDPTIEGLAKEVQKIMHEKNKIEIMPITAIQNKENIPLSFAQQRIWFLNEMEPGSPYYNIPDAFKLYGKLDVPILRESIILISERHELLRTAIINVNGKPQQKIFDKVEMDLPLFDLSVLNKEDAEYEAERITAKEALHSFDLAEPPLFKVTLLKIAEDEFIISFIAHHIIFDDWSSRVFISELSVIYDSLSNGKIPPLRPLKIQYGDFAAWQRNWLKGEVLQNKLNYWKENLKDVPPLLEFPYDHPRPPVQTFNGKYKTFEISKSVTKEIYSLAKNENVTLFMLILAAFDLLLYKYSNQKILSVGTPIANRRSSELEKLIGLFVNTLVLKSEVNVDYTFKQLLRQIKETTLAAYEHQDVPFELVVDTVQPERNLSYSPLFQVMLVFQNTPPQKININSNLTLRPFALHSGTSKFDLTLFIIEDEENLRGAFEYNADLFEPDTIDRMIHRFENILTTVTDNKNILVKNISLVSDSESNDLLKEYNQTENIERLRDYVHKEFENTAIKFADSTALKFNSESISFSELNSKANQLAHYLIELGAGPETIIGVSLKRSFNLVVTLFAILKSGAAYLPLDASYPEDRINYMIDDSKLKMIITEENLSAKFKPVNEIKIIVLDSIKNELAEQKYDNPTVKLDEENIAYVIYTSGSTGKPKGTLITHKGFKNYLSWCLFAYPVHIGNGSLLHSTIAFDATVTSIFPSLLAGKTIFITEENDEIETLGNTLKEINNFSLIKITPAHLKLLTAQLNENELKNVSRSFVIGGENLLYSDIELLQKAAPDTLLFNEYGPTETVVGCVVYEASKSSGNGSVPIGKIIPNTSIYILNKELKPVPKGLSGELYISGEGVARGYLNNPELTAERFIPNPFSNEMGNRMYKTGDIVKLRNDVNLEFLGRADDQIKLKGFRIELSEIEKAIISHESIKDAKVIKKTETNGTARLAAFYTTNIPEAEVPGLKDFLKKNLPDFMLPSSLIKVEKFPLTANGKIDTKKLEDFDVIEKRGKGETVKPSTEMEVKLLQIWKDVLSVENIGVEDNFFELGGDSILTIQIVSRANQIGFNLTPKDIFKFPTIAELAKLSNSNMPRIIFGEQEMIVGEVPLTPIQYWFINQNLEEKHHYNQSVILTVPSGINEIKIRKVITALVKHHDQLRARFIFSQNSARQIISGDININLKTIDLFRYEINEHKGIVEYESNNAQSGISLENSPLNFVLFQNYNRTENLLLIIIHHLVIDGVSWRILLEDMRNAIRQLNDNKDIILPLKTVAYKRWAEELIALADSEEIKNELKYWQSLQPAALIFDERSKDNYEAFTEKFTINFPAEMTLNLLRNSQKYYGAEINEILLTAFTSAFIKWSGKEFLFLNLEGHGREKTVNDINLTRTVGWFTSIYPVNLKVDLGVSSSDKINAVKKQLSNIPAKGMNFGILKFLCGDKAVKEAINNIPQPEIIFNYLGRFSSGGSNSVLQISKGNERNDKQNRLHLIEVDGGVNNNELRFDFTYSYKLIKAESIKSFADEFLSQLIKLVDDIELENKNVNEQEFNFSESDLQEIYSSIEKIKG